MSTVEYGCVFVIDDPVQVKHASAALVDWANAMNRASNSRKVEAVAQSLLKLLKGVNVPPGGQGGAGGDERSSPIRSGPCS